MNRPARDHLHSLLSAVVDGTATDDQFAELSQRLASDAEARRFYVRYLDMNAALLGRTASPSEVPRRRAPWAAIVTSLVAASLLLAWLVAPAARREERPASAEPVEVAVEDAVTRGYVATIASGGTGAVLNGEPVTKGMRLGPGPYALTAGAIDIQFDGGARLLFEGESRFTLHSRRSVAIERATFVFRGDQTCEPIDIATPHSVFRDIGTRYAAVIDARSEEVHVADGAVRRTSENSHDPIRQELITAGAGRRYESGGAGGAAIPLDAALVARSVAGRPRVAGDARPSAADDFHDGGERIGGAASGIGWLGPWVSHKGFPELRLVSPGLARESSMAVLHEASGSPATDRKTAAHRRLQSPIDLSQDGIHYLRFLVRRGPTLPKDEHLAMVVLRTYGLTEQEEIDRSSTIKIAVQGDEGALIRFADTCARASLPQISGQTYAVVAKIVAGRTKPDQVLMRVMAAERLGGSSEPIDWSVVSESIDTDMRLDQVSLEFVSRGRAELGDVCIGPTWESVARPRGQ